MIFSLAGNEEFIKRLTELILENLGDENFGVKELVAKTGMKPSAIHRRLKSFANKTLSQFICEIRLQKSLDLLQQEDLTVSEVAYKVGFSSPAYFNKCFHDYFGYPPGEFKKRGLNPEGEKQDTGLTESSLNEQESLTAETIRPKWALTWTPAIVVLVGLAVYFAYPKLFKRDTLENLRSSGERVTIAVMPFQNLTNDTTWNIWQKGLQDVLTTSLSNAEELRVRQPGSVNTLIKSKGLTNYASLTPSAAGSISQLLDANVFISGQLIKSGDVMRLDGQIIDSKTEEIFKSYQIDGTAEKMLLMIDSLSAQIRDFLIITELKKNSSGLLRLNLQKIKTTNSPLAFKYLLYGIDANSKGDEITAIKYFKQALAVDSNFIQAMGWITASYVNMLRVNAAMEGEAKKWCLKCYSKRDMVDLRTRLDIDYYYARLFGARGEDIKVLRQRLEIDYQQPPLYYIIGNRYHDFYQYAEAIPEYEKALARLDRWKLKPPAIWYYVNLIDSYYNTGEYKKEKKLFKKAEKDYPDNTYLLDRHAFMALKVGDTRTANEYIRKKESLLRRNSASEATIASTRRYIYAEADLLDKAEEEGRKALSLQPENPRHMNNLAWVLINNDKKINEGLELIEKALKINPNDCNSLDTKGWGLHKLGRNKEALTVLLKCDSVKPAYDHGIFLHLEEVKKAVAAGK